jgi:hypothetical protein
LLLVALALLLVVVLLLLALQELVAVHVPVFRHVLVTPAEDRVDHQALLLRYLLHPAAVAQDHQHLLPQVRIRQQG